MKPQSYQYISLIVNSKTLFRLITKIERISNIILDLEDSVYAPNNYELTKDLKKIARMNLLTLFSENPGLKVGLRINSINTNEFNDDILLLNKLKPVSWNFIVLPKLESTDMLNQYIVALQRVGYKNIIICIESKKGTKNLDSILKNNTSDKISKVQFGHFDYFLDSRTFPIPLQTNFEFWRVCERLISVIESNGYMYLHSPLNRLNDPNLMYGILNKLTEICSSSFGIASISYSQTKQIQDFKTTCHELILNHVECDDKRTHAENLILQYQRNRNGNYSFSRNIKDGLFIAPQEYIAAKDFLSKYE